MSSTTINNPEPSANALSHQKVSRLTSTALFAALICVTTAYIFHIPFGVNGGYVHIGDSLIYLAAAFLPTPYAMFARECTQLCRRYCCRCNFLYWILYHRCNPVRNLGCTDSFDCRNPCPVRRKCCDLYHSWFHS